MDLDQARHPKIGSPLSRLILYFTIQKLYIHDLDTEYNYYDYTR